MSRCVICGEPFALQGRDNPEEPCRCGGMLTKADAEDLDRELLEQARRVWGIQSSAPGPDGHP